jgi:hypothetical protein
MRPMMKPSGRTPASQQLLSLSIKLEHRSAITLGELLDDLGSAGVGLTILLLALPVMFPVPGPWGVILGACLAAISVQLLSGAREPWLPGWLRKRSLPIELLMTVIQRSVPWLQWIEAYIRPDRLKALNGRGAQALMGIPMVMLSVALALPLPLGNFLPVLAFIMFALAFLERDGLAVVMGLVLTVFALMWTGILIVLGAEIVYTLLSWVGMGRPA